MRNTHYTYNSITINIVKFIHLQTEKELQSNPNHQQQIVLNSIPKNKESRSLSSQSR